jgi:hypothetical protein
LPRLQKHTQGSSNWQHGCVTITSLFDDEGEDDDDCSTPARRSAACLARVSFDLFPCSAVENINRTAASRLTYQLIRLEEVNHQSHDFD